MTHIIDGKKIRFTRERDPEKLDWKGIDVVFECTGIFTNDEGAGKHLKAGAKKVVISAPGKSDNIKTIIYGVNDSQITKDDKTKYPAHLYVSILRNMGIDVDEFATQKGDFDKFLV